MFREDIQDAFLLNDASVTDLTIKNYSSSPDRGYGFRFVPTNV